MTDSVSDYIGNVLRTKTADELDDLSIRLVAESKSLESSLEMVIYENYERFLSNAEVIEGLASTVDDLEPELEKLADCLSSVSVCSLKLQSIHHDRSRRMQHLLEIRSLLTTLKTLGELPVTVKQLYLHNDLGGAVDLLSNTLPVALTFREELPELVEEITAAATKAMLRLGAHLEDTKLPSYPKMQLPVPEQMAKVIGVAQQLCLPIDMHAICQEYLLSLWSGQLLETFEEWKTAPTLKGLVSHVILEVGLPTLLLTRQHIDWSEPEVAVDELAGFFFLGLETLARSESANVFVESFEVILTALKAAQLVTPLHRTRLLGELGGVLLRLSIMVNVASCIPGLVALTKTGSLQAFVSGTQAVEQAIMNGAGLFLADVSYVTRLIPQVPLKHLAVMMANRIPTLLCHFERLVRSVPRANVADQSTALSALDAELQKAVLTCEPAVSALSPASQIDLMLGLVRICRHFERKGAGAIHIILKDTLHGVDTPLIDSRAVQAQLNRSAVDLVRESALKTGVSLAERFASAIASQGMEEAVWPAALSSLRTFFEAERRAGVLLMDVPADDASLLDAPHLAALLSKTEPTEQALETSSISRSWLMRSSIASFWQHLGAQLQESPPKRPELLTANALFIAEGQCLIVGRGKQQADKAALNAWVASLVRETLPNLNVNSLTVTIAEAGRSQFTDSGPSDLWM
ncbi:MAG: hypothetical protein KVP17_000722 [Porospora cf. gigantea B]|uniref:uncharacterized protein n=1 Tax=Porospora cf. gigantea B TaxID=2853592 RepID=UPI003571AE06|nr:MAG: hypothetical protein KVP17_000722 [Porospora cf. gigantea B]